ncbi:MAG: nitrite/sulfite reductase, partial [Parvularcula sp.]|nr:nitrite/sulfite reductase [Parvularcula sp.]
RSDAKAAIGTIVGRGLSTDEVVDAIDRLITFYLDQRTDASERFIDLAGRLGADAFGEVLYADA